MKRWFSNGNRSESFINKTTETGSRIGCDRQRARMGCGRQRTRIDLLNFINVSLWRTSAWSAGDSTSGIPIRYPHAGPGDDSTVIPAGDAVFKDL